MNNSNLRVIDAMGEIIWAIDELKRVHPLGDRLLDRQAELAYGKLVTYFEDLETIAELWGIYSEIMFLAHYFRMEEIGFLRDSIRKVSENKVLQYLKSLT